MCLQEGVTSANQGKDRGSNSSSLGTGFSTQSLLWKKKKKKGLWLKSLQALSDRSADTIEQYEIQCTYIQNAKNMLRTLNENTDEHLKMMRFT
jgi:hypothetical protein